MKVFENIEELKSLKVSSVSIGNFDGLHLGHQAIIKKLKNSTPNLVITFEPHPREIIPSKNSTEKTFSSAHRLTTKEEKIILFEELGIDNLLILKFDQKLLQMSASEFVKWLLVEHIKPNEVVIGYNHHFGQGASGGFELLVHMGVQFGFSVTRVLPMFLNGFPVSSTWTRNALAKGDATLTSKLLGRQYSILSYVISGEKRGTTLGYPTANLEVPKQKLIPKNGVYAVRATIFSPASQFAINNNYQNLSGMMSIGNKPTFPESKFGIEVHIFDFNKNLLEQLIKVEFVKYLRPNRPFENQEALKTQLKIDESIARKILI